MDANEFAKYIQEKDMTVLDVRTTAEHDEGYIPGTDFNIDVLEGSFTKIATEKLPKDKPVALYCHSGNSSKTAARIWWTRGMKPMSPSLSDNMPFHRQ